MSGTLDIYDIGGRFSCFIRLIMYVLLHKGYGNELTWVNGILKNL